MSVREIFYQHLEIDSEQKEELRRCQLAYLTDKKQFVYCDNNGKYVYFKSTPEFKEAIQNSFKRAFNEYNR